MIKLDSVSEKTEKELKPCPFCGSVINFRIKTIHFFECNKCGAVVSFTGRKKVTFGITEAENPIKNWNRRADNEV